MFNFHINLTTKEINENIGKNDEKAYKEDEYIKVRDYLTTKFPNVNKIVVYRLKNQKDESKLFVINGETTSLNNEFTDFIFKEKILPKNFIEEVDFHMPKAHYLSDNKVEFHLPKYEINWFIKNQMIAYCKENNLSSSISNFINMPWYLSANKWDWFYSSLTELKEELLPNYSKLLEKVKSSNLKNQDLNKYVDEIKKSISDFNIEEKVNIEFKKFKKKSERDFTYLNASTKNKNDNAFFASFDKLMKLNEKIITNLYDSDNKLTKELKDKNIWDIFNFKMFKNINIDFLPYCIVNGQGYKSLIRKYQEITSSKNGKFEIGYGYLLLVTSINLILLDCLNQNSINNSSFEYEELDQEYFSYLTINSLKKRCT